MNPANNFFILGCTFLYLLLPAPIVQQWLFVTLFNAVHHIYCNICFLGDLFCFSPSVIQEISSCTGTAMISSCSIDQFMIFISAMCWAHSNINVWFQFIYSQKWNCDALLFPKQNYNVLSPNFHINVSVSCELIYSHDLSAYLAVAK